MPSLDEIHRVSDQLQRRANLVTLAWALSIIPLEPAVAMAVQPNTRTFNGQMVYSIMPIALFFFLYLKCSGHESPFTSIQCLGHAHTELERKRDALQSRLERMGLALTLSLMMWLSPVLFYGLLLRSTHVMRNWGFVNGVVFAIQALVFFAVVSRPTRRALSALEQEIEATASTGDSIEKPSIPN
jgi:hypothetical protein